MAVYIKAYNIKLILCELGLLVIVLLPEYMSSLARITICFDNLFVIIRHEFYFLMVFEV